mgnify:CR=1 FL=1
MVAMIAASFQSEVLARLQITITVVAHAASIEIQFFKTIYELLCTLSAYLTYRVEVSLIDTP